MDTSSKKQTYLPGGGLLTARDAAIRLAVYMARTAAGSMNLSTVAQRCVVSFMLLLYSFARD